ncbi:RHS repeat-associated protein [Aquisalibacillus elongatus]|uniref:RHS repeat-associated protein n=2 Tax=Aquisalibacillus elongatus TaxID=485577 RepID=A0A3N5BFS6_9BACI|nr:RHS repeat-associated protein [Aquisalibacillus elongatus]
MYYHYDGMSSVSELTDRHGDIIERYRYDAFGGLMTGITAPYNTNNYTGHQYDQDTGLIDMQARTYDAKIGRFLQEDTYQGTLDTPLSQNRYAYVMNDPVNYWDPTGNVPEALTDENRAAVTNFNDFHRQEERDDRLESWKYTYQEGSYYSNLDGEKLNLQETQTSSAKTITWSQMLYEQWTYDGELIGYFDEDGVGHPEAGGTKEQVFYQFTENFYETTITAEDMLKTNLEWLLQHGNVPVSQYKTGSSTMTFDEVHEQYPSVFEKGRFDSNSFDELVNYSNAKSKHDSIQRLEARENQAYKTLQSRRQQPTDKGGWHTAWQIAAGFGSGVLNGAQGTVQGVYTTVTHPIQTTQAVYHTATTTSLDDIATGAENYYVAFRDGDAYTRSKMVGEFGAQAVGAKGLGKLGNAASNSRGGNNKQSGTDVEDSNPSVNEGKVNVTVPQNAKDIAKQIKQNNGTPPQGYKGGREFKNDVRDGGQVLPQNTTYKEYDIHPHVKGQNRGAERIVIGKDGSVWYTNDHYKTFTRIE